jgi:hypothetical protein
MPSDRFSSGVGTIPTARWLAAAIAIILAGCGPSLARVSGTVSFNGEPVSKGTVTLVPANGKGAASGGLIENGRYTIEKVQPGEKLVQLSSPYPMGSQKDDSGSESNLYGDLMPASWGRASQNKIDVTAGSLAKNFEITGPDPRKQ